MRPFVTALFIAGGIPALAQTSATIDIDTTTTIPVNPGFSGFNASAGPPIEYWDYRFNTMALVLNTAWLRFPGGTESDVFNWQTGQIPASWVAQFGKTSQGSELENNQALVAGKGGAGFIDASNRANFLGAGQIVCVNGFTDTPASAGAYAAYAKANGIPVAVWELSNEPYLFPTFFATGADYIAKMKPYRDAIKAADPNAIVSIFFADPSAFSVAKPSPWDQSISKVTDKWWDAVTYHQYPAESTGDFNQWMADENAVLVSKTSQNVTGYLASLNPPDTKYEISEFEPSHNSTPSLTDGTLYGGVYSAEYILRMSTVPAVLYVGANQINHDSGIEFSTDYSGRVSRAGAAGQTLDTSTLNFGFYYDAQSIAIGIVNGVVNSAAKSNKTTVTGGATIAATGLGLVPALYAMSYTNAVAGVSVIVTNKSATAQQVTVRLNGATAPGPLQSQFVSGANPSANNSAATPTAIAIQTAASGNPVTVGPYSVTRLDLVAPPVATFVNTASQRPGSYAPSQQVTALGSGFAAQSIVAPTDPPPAMLGDTTIAVTDSGGTVWMVPLYSVSPSQATFLMPDGIVGGPATVAVMRSGSTVLTGSFNVVPSAPGIFTANGNGAGAVAATASLAAPDGTVTPLQVYSCKAGVAFSCLETPLSLGDGTDTVTLTIPATGLRWAQSVLAYVAGQPAPVLDFEPQALSGLDQVDITLPPSLAGAGEVSLYLVVDGNLSNVASLKIQ